MTPSAMLTAIQRQAACRTSTAAASTLAEMNAGAAQLALARVTNAVTVTSASVGIAKHSISRSARPMSGLNMRTQTISSTLKITGPNTPNWLATNSSPRSTLKLAPSPWMLWPTCVSVTKPFCATQMALGTTRATPIAAASHSAGERNSARASRSISAAPAMPSTK